MNKQKTEYFTDDIRSQISNMTTQEMNTILKGIEGTPIWTAILRYSQERIGVIQGSFLTIDPNSKATEIARYQGAITGMLDLQDAILSLKFPEENPNSPEAAKEKEKNDAGGAYGKY